MKKKAKKSAKKTPATSTTPRAPRALPALRSWLEHPSATVRKRFASALERAASPRNPEHRASVAVGRRRIQVQASANGYEAFNPINSYPAPFVKQEKRVRTAKSTAGETPAQAKRRAARDISQKSKRDASAALKRRDLELRTKAKTTRKERSSALKGARQACDVDRGKARAVKGPGRRVAAAKARTRCAGRALSVEQRFARQLDEVRQDVEKLKQERRSSRRYGKARPRPAAEPRGRERREERDDAITSELERRGLAHLIPIWNAEKDGPALRGLKFDRAIERFLEGVAERHELEQLGQEQVESAVAETVQCEQAAFYAGQGDPQASLWREENCDEDNRPRRRLSELPL